MKNNNSQLLNEDGFINLKDILILIKKSKKLIFFITLIFVVATSFYSLNRTGDYSTELKVNLGQDFFSRGDLIDPLKQVENTLNFYWPDTIIESSNPSFLIVNFIGPMEMGKKVTDEIIGFLEKEESNQLKLKKESVINKINYWSKKKAKVDEEFNRLMNLDALPNNDSRKDVFMSELLIQRNDFKLEIEKLNSQTFEKSLEFHVKTENTYNLYRQLLLGLISGLLFSILTIIFKSTLTSLKQD